MSKKEADKKREKLRLQRLAATCPCGSGYAYSDCCRYYHSGRKNPATPEQLMRARHAAYYYRQLEFLIASTHPDVRDPGLRKQLTKTLHNLTWGPFEILSTSKGGEIDKKGKVEYKTSYSLNGEVTEIHEKARCQRYKGYWKFVDGRG